MPENQNPPPGGQGGAPNGAANTGGPTPSANPGLTLADIESLFDRKVSPLAADIAHLKNGQAAAQRVAGKPDAGNGGGTNPNAIDLSKLPDNIRAVFEANQRELASLREREESRTKAEQGAKATTALDAAIKAGNYANSDVLRELLASRVRLNDAGQPVYDDGARVRPIEEVVREKGALDMFRPASAGQGAGARPGTPDAGGRPGVRRVTAAEIEAMPSTSTEFATLSKDIQEGRAVLVD